MKWGLVREGGGSRRAQGKKERALGLGLLVSRTNAQAGAKIQNLESLSLRAVSKVRDLGYTSNERKNKLDIIKIKIFVFQRTSSSK